MGAQDFGIGNRRRVDEPSAKARCGNALAH
jgi:hypothetical protein